MAEAWTDPVGELDDKWIQFRRQGLWRMQALVQEGQLRQSDVVVLMTMALHQNMQTGDVRITLAELCKQLRGGVGPMSHCLRRLRAAGLLARVGGLTGNGYYVVSPLVSSCGGPRERRNHERLFKAALEQQVPVRPATPAAVAARHALPSQLAPAA